MDLMKTLTTIIALAYRGGVVMAADRQTTIGWGEKMCDTTKISRVSTYSIFGAAGLVSYIQELEKLFKIFLGNAEQFVERSIYIDGQAQLLEYILKNNFQNRYMLDVLFGYVAVPILAGWDPEEKRSRIFSYDSAGAIYEATTGERQYVTVGSGGRPARIVLDDRWQHNLKKQQAIELAIRAVYRAGENDLGTSFGQLFPITVFMADKKGITQLAEESTFDYAQRIFLEDLIRRESSLRSKFFEKIPEEEPS